MTAIGGRRIGFDFTGQSVVVTGAARGIGVAIAERFVQSGAEVFLADRDEEELIAAADRVGGHPFVLDVTSTEEVEALIAHVVRTTGRLDVLVNNAGILRDRMLWKLDDAEWDAVLAVHAGGTFRTTRACVPQFRAQGYGRIINVTSYTGLHGNLGQANYATAKAGIIGFTKTAAKELAAFGVTVNAVSPNAATRMTASIPVEKQGEVTGAISRLGDPEEIAGAVCFLASEETAYVTGIVLPVDGGLSM